MEGATALEPIDNNQRLLFLQFMEQLTNDPKFTLKIIYTEGVWCTRNGVSNFYHQCFIIIWSTMDYKAAVNFAINRRNIQEFHQ